MTAREKITPCLWFDGQAEEAVNFYVAVFGGRIHDVSRYSRGMHMPEGTVLTMTFELAGRRFMALNGGPNFKFTEAISLSVDCQSQGAVDDLWAKLTADGGAESMCGWLRDKYGLSWQIVPARLVELMKGSEPLKTQRMMGAMMQMRKLDIARLEAAHAGD